MATIMVDEEKVTNNLKYWGDLFPMMAMEECGELIQAISKMERFKSGHLPKYADHEMSYKDNLLEEIRDVYMVLATLQVLYDIKNTDVQKSINEKLDRTY